jgi:hypothetical protein
VVRTIDPFAQRTGSSQEGRALGELSLIGLWREERGTLFFLFLSISKFEID